jgi:hypothetical protein
MTLAPWGIPHASAATVAGLVQADNAVDGASSRSSASLGAGLDRLRLR